MDKEFSTRIEAVGFVAAPRLRAEDDFWGGEEACIELAERFTEDALAGLDAFSHAEIVYVFHRVDEAKITPGARHPRNNRDWPAVGIFAQRAKGRPNRIGSTMCRILRVDGRRLYVAELDAIDGTPVIDIKPVIREFLPRGELRQPPWATELMQQYWLTKNA